VRAVSAINVPCPHVLLPWVIKFSHSSVLPRVIMGREEVYIVSNHVQRAIFFIDFFPFGGWNIL